MVSTGCIDREDPRECLYAHIAEPKKEAEYVLPLSSSFLIPRPSPCFLSCGFIGKIGTCSHISPPFHFPLPSLLPSSPPLPFSALYSRYEVSSVTGPIRWKRGGSQDTGDRLYTASSTASSTQPNATAVEDATTAVAGAAGAEEAAEQIPLYQVRHNSKPSMV